MDVYHLKSTYAAKSDLVVFAAKASDAGKVQGFPYSKGDYLVSNENRLTSAVPYSPSKFDAMYELA